MTHSVAAKPDCKCMGLWAYCRYKLVNVRH